VENYAVVERLRIPFHSGLNLLTGETGSGKSIVVDAVELLLGGKASTDLIRSGSERAQISGVFTGGPSSTKASSAQWKRLRRLLDESGVELEDGEELIVQRDITAGGKSRVFVNHSPATAGLLKMLAPYLAEVHGQNEQQEIFSPAAQLEMLDRFGGLAPLASQLRERFAEWRALREQKENLALRQRERIRQMDLWLFQKKEIEQAALIPGEDQELEKEKLILAHATRIHASLASAFDLLYDASGSATAAIASACRNLEEVTAFDASLAPLVENLRSAQSTADDVALTLRDRLSSLEVSPRRLEDVEDRLALLDRLKRKYGNTLDEVIGYFEQISADVREAESTEALGEELDKKIAASSAAYKNGAAELSARRRAASGELKREMEKELKALAMAGTVFEARLESSSEEGQWSASGVDRVEYLISPNPGEPLRALNRIASGGEISRIMLALETAIDARRGAGGREHTLIFDEVDTGIGGIAAETVGKKLRQLGEGRQVLCVTHLPQIASFAHQHYRVEKSESAGRTTTTVEYLHKSERASELARMLSGSKITDAVLKHAEQLLKANS
jgi:DNA repair protein RecN (Recombination protein N)